jgi:Tol biopolymer transport system component
MRIRHALVLVAIIAAASFTVAGQTQTVETMMEAAKKLEVVDGDLTGAIKQYQALVDRFGRSDRRAAAGALLRIAALYEKQKQASPQAQEVYERVVKEYADIATAASEARAYLRSTPSAVTAAPASATPAATQTGIVTRQVLTAQLSNEASSISPDGRYLTYVIRDTAQNGDLALHDFSTGQNRRLTNNASTSHPTFPDRSVVAPDGNRVAYAWWDIEGGGGFRVIDVRGTVLHSIDWNDEIGYLDPHDWSADGKWIAVQSSRPGLRQIGLVNAATGSMQVLKSVGWRHSTRMAFSPDGKYIAFDLPPGDDVEQHDLFVLAVDGSREIPAVVDPSMDTLIGWAPDGRHLLFASDRSGSNGLWAQPFREGRPHGAPQLVKSDFGRPIPVGVTRAGALYYAVSVSGQAISVASVDFDSAKLLTPPTPVIKYGIGSHRQPSWSSDGKYVAYSSGNENGGPRQPILSIQSIETGQVRQVRPRLDYFQTPNWAPDAKSFVAQATDTKGRQGIHRIDPQTGATELIEARAVFPIWAPGGTKIVYTRVQTREYIERDLASGTERVITGFPTEGCRALSLSISPDAQRLAAICNPTPKRYSLIVVPTAGGVPRELHDIDSEEGAWTTWTSDGRWILFGRDANVWIIAAEGGAARRIDFGVSEIRDLRVQPGGNKVVFWYNKGARSNSQEGLYVMERFLP